MFYTQLVSPLRAQTHKSFLLLFFKKVALAFFFKARPHNFVPRDDDENGVRAGPGSYYLGNNPHVYDDHWSGLITPHNSRAMLIFDGAYDPNMQAWISQPITVEAHRSYNFSAFAAALFPDNPAELEFRIYGQQIGPVFVPNQPPGQWTQFNAVWNSGNSTAVVISIYDETTTGIGNDFALDDLSFVEQPWFYDVENWSGNAWIDVTGWISPGGIFTFGLAVFGIGLAILGVGLAVLGIQLASLLAGED